MKKLSIVYFLLIHMFAYSQSETFELAKKANSVEDLIPNNWKILAIAKGDLNGDKTTDVAFVIEQTDKNKLKLNEGGLGRDTINLNPRILGIYFGKKSGKLMKQLQADSFILLQDSPTMDEPFDGIEILESGVLKIDFKFWYSAGSWSMSNHTYNFRFQNGEFELISYEANERHRGTGEEVDHYIDFSTGKMNIVKMIIDDDGVEKAEEEIQDFKLEKRKTIRSLKKPFQWELLGVYL